MIYEEVPSSPLQTSPFIRGKTLILHHESCIISVRVVPRASRVKILKEAEHFKIKLTSAPVDQAVNRQLQEVLANKLSLPMRNIEIIPGLQSRNKRVSISGLNEQQVFALLAP